MDELLLHTQRVNSVEHDLSTNKMLQEADNIATERKIEELRDSFTRQIEHSAAETYRLDTRIDTTHLDISFKVSYDELKRNFDTLNELLNLQWKHMDEIRKGLRSVITYQKYFHPLQT